MMTCEYNTEQEAVEIYCDREGLELLVKKLDYLKKAGGHLHSMTRSWAGNELDEELQGRNKELINHIVIAVKPE